MAAQKPVVVRICSRFAVKSNENSGNWQQFLRLFTAPDNRSGSSFKEFSARGNRAMSGKRSIDVIWHKKHSPPKAGFAVLEGGLERTVSV